MTGGDAILVVRGDPTPEELAAAVAVVQARAAALAARGEDEAEATRAVPGAWSDPARTMPRALPAPGPHAWQRSHWPG